MWVRLDDKCPRHPKMLRLGAEAFALWVAGLCYAAEYGTDGHLPPEAVGVLTWYSADAAKRLEAAGLWEDVGDGWRIHDFLAYNPPAAQAKAKREAHARRMRDLRDKSREGARDESQDMSRADHVRCQSGLGDGTGSGSSPDPDPKSERSTPRARGPAPLPVKPRAAARLLAEAGRPRVVLPLDAQTDTGLQPLPERVLVEVLTQKRPTIEELQRVCAWLNQPGTWSHLRSGISARQLLGKPEQLAEAIDLARAWDGAPIEAPGQRERAQRQEAEDERPTPPPAEEVLGLRGRKAGGGK